MIALHESCVSPVQEKRIRVGKYTNVMGMVLMFTNLNIPISGAMGLEEALLIFEKLRIKGFPASKSWLKSFKNSTGFATCQ